MTNIVLLKDLIDSKQRKEEELLRYQSHLEKLLGQLTILRKEIALTERIINMVKREQIIEIFPKTS
jgi:hypothetical protein